MLIDAHAHFQRCDGMLILDDTPGQVLSYMDRVGCDYLVQTGCGVTAGMDVQKHREYPAFCENLYEISGGRVLSYFIFNPALADIDLAAMEEHHAHKAFRGIKLHPSGQGFWASGEEFRPVWEAAKRYNLPILAHTWALTSNPKQKYSTPDQFVKYLEEYPEVNFIFGHSGGRISGIHQAAEIGKTHKNAYFDMAGDVYSRHFVEYMVERVGADKLLVGSDLNWFCLSPAVGMVLGANISTKDKEKILGENAAKLFKIY